MTFFLKTKRKEERNLFHFKIFFMNFKTFLFCNICTDVIFTLSWGNEIGVSKEYFCDLKKVNEKNMKL
jgi:hypothetical protein